MFRRRKVNSSGNGTSCLFVLGILGVLMALLETGGIGTKRFCSSVNLGNYCDEVKQPGDQLTYRTCVYTCDSDGCNPASRISPSSQLNVLQLTAMLVVFGSFYSMR
ncbi:uncharacterized protein LOC106645199 [Copidosoma floridanum]|uniref:uncharacterized protein LOC106645199 n=1 Tax=Copidosoma floridanum TaxID=29053 RepID=UPI0006C9A2CC|nr:uncharacterized protein LOC106645199 [Copidosoma floridanum]